MTALLTPHEAAEQLRLRGGARGVTRLVRRGDLKAVRIGREYRIPVESITDYLRAHEVRT